MERARGTRETKNFVIPTPSLIHNLRVAAAQTFKKSAPAIMRCARGLTTRPKLTRKDLEF